MARSKTQADPRLVDGRVGDEARRGPSIAPLEFPMKKQTKKLVLAPETLSHMQLTQVAGGGASNISGCMTKPAASCFVNCP